jgi:hypothetical protein
MSRLSGVFPFIGVVHHFLTGIEDKGKRRKPLGICGQRPSNTRYGKAGKRYGKDQANVVAKNFGPNRKRACESRFIERIGPAATYII